MNGIEAIKHMEQGGMVYRIYEDGIVCYRMKLGMVQTKVGATWTVATVFNVLDWYEEYTKPEPSVGWELVDENCVYYFINDKNVSKYYAETWSVDNNRYDNANYFSTKEKAEEINFKQTLFRKLQRFSDENDGNEKERRYYIVYNSFTDEIKVNYSSYLVGVGEVRFTSKETAQQTIELFHDDLIKYFTM